MTIKESCFLNSSTFDSECSSSRTEYNRVGRYSSSFKQKVVNEVQLGNYKRHIAEKYQIPPKTVLNWTKEACNPTPKIKKPEKRKKYSPDFKRKVISEVCLGESNCKVAKKYQIPPKTVLNWTKKAPKIRIPEKAKRYSPDFKRKVISEVCLGKSKAYVAKKYQISRITVLNWTKKAHLPVEPTPVIKEPLEKETHPLEFKQKVVSEVCSGQHISQVCKNYNLYQSNLYIWLEQAYSPNFPYNSSAAWTDKP